MKLFEESGCDIVKMATIRLDALRSNRLNVDRVAGLKSDNPEIDRLLGLCGGMTVPKPEGLVSNGATSEKGLHSAYKRVHHAVDKMLGDFHDQQLGFILPEKAARELIEHHRLLGK
jgi:hypothetical protein